MFTNRYLWQDQEQDLGVFKSIPQQKSFTDIQKSYSAKGHNCSVSFIFFHEHAASARYISFSDTALGSSLEFGAIEVCSLCPMVTFSWSVFGQIFIGLCQASVYLINFSSETRSRALLCNQTYMVLFLGQHAECLVERT